MTRTAYAQGIGYATVDADGQVITFLAGPCCQGIADGTVTLGAEHDHGNHHLAICDPVTGDRVGTYDDDAKTVTDVNGRTARASTPDEALALMHEWSWDT